MIFHEDFELIPLFSRSGNMDKIISNAGEYLIHLINYYHSKDENSNVI